LCIRVKDIDYSLILLDKCDKKARVSFSENGFIKSTYSDTLCLGIISSSDNRLQLNSCDTNKKDQIWQIKIENLLKTKKTTTAKKTTTTTTTKKTTTTTKKTIFTLILLRS